MGLSTLERLNRRVAVSFFVSVALFLSPVVAAENTKVLVETNRGSILVELFDDRAPITVANFLSYVDKKHYDGTIFHRVIPRFMIQGGGFNPAMEELPTDAPIENESKNRIHNERGTLAMARTADPHSATSQFYINVRMNISLDYRMGEFGYAVFGKVLKGMDVVDTISVQQTTSLPTGHSDVPVEDIIIQRISRVGK